MSMVRGVSISSNYSWLHSVNCRVRYKWLDKEILASYKQSRSNYGSPRVAQDLALKGIVVSRSTVARRMKVLGIEAKRQKKYRPCTTESRHGQRLAPNLLNRDFQAKKIAEKWVSDITYLKVGRSWNYLCTVIDLADRAVVGWSLSDTMSPKQTTIEAFKRAISNRKPQKQMIFHSDRGVQYAAQEFQDLLAENTCRQSMSRKGNCWDNAVAESFFKSLKVECLNRKQLNNKEQAYATIFSYIDGWYNTKRIHSSLGGIPPAKAYSNLRNQSF
mgnify:CR=1 FL=1